MALRNTIGPHRCEVKGNWRKLHSEVLHDLYSSPDVKPRRMRYARHVAPIGETKDACRNLVGISEGKTPLGKPRWEHNIKLDLKGKLRQTRTGLIQLRIRTSGGLL